MIRIKIFLCVLFLFAITGAGTGRVGFLTVTLHAAAPDNNTLLMPVATGLDVKKNEKVQIDASNIKNGYVMIKYEEKTTKDIRVIIKTPRSTQYIYSLKANGEYEVFPFSEGSGSYSIGIYENTTGKKYATVYTVNLEVALINEFAPFLLPNQYVNYRTDSETVKKAAELANSTNNTIENISALYNHIIKNIKYDTNLASEVRSGKVSIYVPNADAALKSGKGICLDYASALTAMLRSQGIPTKFEVGYVKNIYHAWISTYTVETGWVNNSVFFNGNAWKLMDPTFASTENQSDEVMQFIGDEKNYMIKYIY